MEAPGTLGKSSNQSWHEELTSEHIDRYMSEMKQSQEKKQT
jgi:hypothetical protein